MIEKLRAIKPKKNKNTRIILNKIIAFRVRYKDMARLIDDDAIVAHLYTVCADQYETVLANTELNAAGGTIKFEDLIKQMIVSFRIRQGSASKKKDKDDDDTGTEVALGAFK